MIRASCEVIVLTASSAGYQAIQRFLHKPQELVHASGTIYSWGTCSGTQRTWRVAVAQIGSGGTQAAIEAEKAMHFFQAQIALFVGIANGRNNVQPGDVVVATKIYAYESGKDGLVFEPRPELWRTSYALEQRARREALDTTWLARLEGASPEPAPHVHLGPLAAGAQIITSTRSQAARLLTATYGDTLAVEMEGHGFLQAVRANHTVHGLVICGVAHQLDEKTAIEDAGWQRTAVQHAAAFAFQVLGAFSLPVDTARTGDSHGHREQKRPQNG